MLSETDLNRVVILPNIGKITVKDALAKGLLEPPHNISYGKTFEEITCLVCGKTFTAYSCEEQKYCSRECYFLDRKGDKNTAKRPEVRRNISRALKGRKFTPEHCENISKALAGRKCPDIMGDKNPAKKILGKTWEEGYGVKKAKEMKENLSKVRKGRKKPPKFREKCRTIQTERWKDIKYAKMMWEAFDKKPNNLEKGFNNLLQQICPGEFRYVGDGTFILGGKCPDFKHVKQKKLIELYGDYWHWGDDPQERVKFFKKYGFDTLVIWESEFWDEPKAVTRKVLSFIGD